MPPAKFPLIVINGQVISQVKFSKFLVVTKEFTLFKLLGGGAISAGLKWDVHVHAMLSKANQRCSCSVTS